MPDPRPGFRLRPSLPGLTIALLVAGPALMVVGHQFVYDDILIIHGNPAVHTLNAPWRFFTEQYWPAQFVSGLYRPVSSLLFAVQWVVGGGHPALFHAVSILLYVGLSLAVLRLSREILPAGAAWAVAALFAVHPVHTEAVASAVNQSELLTSLILVSTAAWYVARRRAGRFRPGVAVGVLAGYALACFVKETGLILPVLLLATEVTILRSMSRGGEGIARLRPFYLTMAAVGLAYIAIRGAALRGDLVGSFAADALVGHGVGGRFLTMLGVVPEWARLLFWPSHLQLEYTPLEITAASGWGAEQTAGLLLVLLTLLVAVSAWRRHPGMTFAIAWTAVALGPVHNVLVPTGVVLAERTLLLPSVGSTILIGFGLVLLHERLANSGARLRWFPIYAFAVLLSLGVWKTVDRYPSWRNQLVLLRQGAEDAPLSYRAHYAYGDLLARVGDLRGAEIEYQTAIRLLPTEMRVGTMLARRTTRVYQSLGDLYRRGGFCEPAIEAYAAGLAQSASIEFNDVRQSMVACLLFVGEYRRAAAEARIGVSGGWNVATFQTMLATADSARRVGASPGSVRVLLE